MGILQLAHGEIYMLGAFAVYYFVGKGLASIPPSRCRWSLLAVFGVVMERGLFRSRPGRDPVLSSIVISTGLDPDTGQRRGRGVRPLHQEPALLVAGLVHGGGATVPKDRIVAIAFSVVALLLLYAFLKRTRLGLAMVASAQNREGSFLKGINPNVMSMSAMAIGCALAALAGTLAGSILQLQPYMGGLPMIKGPGDHRAGRVGQHPRRRHRRSDPRPHRRHRAVFGGAAAAAVAPLVIVILVLLFRPKGLLGHE